MFNFTSTDVPSVDSFEAAPNLFNYMEEIQYPTELTEQGNGRIAIACASFVTIGAVIVWKSPLGKKIRTKIASAINPVEPVKSV
jgi:hypothetical protein